MTARRPLLLVALVGAAAGFLQLTAAADQAPAAVHLSAVPMQLAGWHGIDEPPLDAETQALLAADAYLLRSYRNGPMAATLFVAYYASQRTGHSIHSPLNCLPGSGWAWVDQQRERIAGRSAADIEINRNVARQGNEFALVYYWYQSRDRAVASDFQNKLLLVRDAIVAHRSDGALVRVTMPLASGVVAGIDQTSPLTPMAHAVYAALAQHLPE